MAASSRPRGSSSSSRCSGRRSPSRWSAPGDGRSTTLWAAPAEGEAAGVSGRPFLTARWRHLLLLNYQVDPPLLEPLVPNGTELDAWEGRTLMSLVGFRFLDTAVLGVPVPGHRHFTEVNLRFYVRRRSPGGPPGRGGVFHREGGPKGWGAWDPGLGIQGPFLRVPMT